MCLLCVLQFAGEMAVQGASSVCRPQQGEYTINSVESESPKGRDWRSYLCCCSQSGKRAAHGSMHFLHGVLYLVVEEAIDIPDVDNSWFRSSKDVSDPYVTVDICVGGKKTCRIAKTSIIYNSLNPHWNERFRIELCHDAESLLFAVKDMDLVSVESIGYVSIRAQDLIAEEPVAGFYPIIGSDGSPAGSLKISVHFQSVESITRSNEVPDTVFPLRRGCRVNLYQDAHTPALSPITDVISSNGKSYQPHNLWEEINDLLLDAKEFIYIVGWSIKTDISLQRGKECETLGNLLKRKAEEGVRVLLLVWNEALSTDIYTPGIMGTHDEETRQFFDGTEVEVVLAPRKKNKGKIFETSYVSTLYTHHQKSVIIDVAVEGNEKRGLVAFVGGLDLTDGRWDTPEHCLFKTLPNEHSYDFYNGCCSTSATIGPRQPWHDIHAKIQGPAVNDIISNFVERWRKQAPEWEHRLLSITDDKFLVNWENMDDPNPWCVQFLRSINSDSALFGTNVLDRLLTRKGRLYDNSIQRAYVHHIRRAQNYIFLENQYFLGSAHGWLVHEAKCPHLIPVELATKIVTSIKAGNPFRVYVVIPLHPEGDPASTAVQEILHWQHCTMEMMYRKISKTLRKMDSQALPTDYLSFFCLGKREASDEVPENLEAPPENSVASEARKHMRFMIYVHSKLAIFDDEYAIIGSANINERSMNGNRDTEMAVGVFQDGFTKEDCPAGDIKGDVHNFRMALWAEHCGKTLEEHVDPSSLACMKAMREMGEDNLKLFLSDSPNHNDSHLLLYPIEVDRNGSVSVRKDCKHFPDTRASILGKNSTFLPNTLTT